MAFGMMRKPPQCGAAVFWLAAWVVAAASGFSAPAQPAQAEERTGGAEIPVVLAATLPLEAFEEHVQRIFGRKAHDPRYTRKAGSA